MDSIHEVKTREKPDSERVLERYQQKIPAALNPNIWLVFFAAQLLVLPVGNDRSTRWEASYKQLATIRTQ